MQWVSTLSTRPSLEAAVDEVIAATQAALDAPPHLGFVFISSTFASEYPRLLPLLHERLEVPALIGCGGGGIIGNYPAAKSSGVVAPDKPPIEEVEDEPALVLCLAHLPGVNVDVFWLDEEQLPDLDAPPTAWVDYVGVEPSKNPDFIILADPFTSKVSDLLQGMDFAYPSSVKVGGLASGGTANRANGLFCNEQYYEEGTIGVALSGNIALQSVVAQGCRPVGPIFRVLEGERNVILKLEVDSEEEAHEIEPDSTPLEALQSLLRKLTEEERELAQRSLFVGVAYSEFQDKLEQGNFLVRSLVGIDPRVGAIAVGERVRPGQRIQFHLRDASTASEDLAVMLERHNRSHQQTTAQMNNQLAEKPFGALMFSCLGRGEELYNAVNVDSQIFQSYMPPLSIAGCFCNGELGPISGSTYVHGYTAVFGLLYERHTGEG